MHPFALETFADSARLALTGLSLSVSARLSFSTTRPRNVQGSLLHLFMRIWSSLTVGQTW